jgi:hypothetical protein
MAAGRSEMMTADHPQWRDRSKPETRNVKPETFFGV